MPKVSSTASKCILNEREIQSLHSKLPRYSKLSVEEFTNRYMQPTSSNALSGLRVDDLKEILRFIKAEKSMLHVAMSGNKADLVDRIIHLLFGEQHSKSSSQTGHSSMNALQVERTRSTEEGFLHNTIDRMICDTKLLKGLIDPRYCIEKVIDVKWFQIGTEKGGGYATHGFGFQLTSDILEKLTTASDKYEINVHLFENSSIDLIVDNLPLKPCNWADEIVPSVNSTKVLKPKMTKALIKKQKGPSKIKYVTSTPIRLQLTSQKKAKGVVTDAEQVQYCLQDNWSQWNRFELAVPKFSRFDGVLLFSLSSVRDCNELVEEVKRKHEDAKQHDLDIDGDVDMTENRTNVQVKLEEELMAPVLNNDDDDITIAAEEVIPLADPLTMSRIELAAKGKFCVHKRCFDLSTYIDLCLRTRVWQCPACDRRCPFEELVIDDLVNEILANPKTAEVAKVKVHTQTGQWEVFDKKEYPVPGSRSSQKASTTSTTTSLQSPLTSTITAPSTPPTPAVKSISSIDLAEIIIDDLDSSDDDPSSSKNMLPPLYAAQALISQFFGKKYASQSTTAGLTTPLKHAPVIQHATPTGGETIDDAIEID